MSLDNEVLSGVDKLICSLIFCKVGEFFLFKKTKKKNKGCEVRVTFQREIPAKVLMVGT